MSSFNSDIYWHLKVELSWAQQKVREIEMQIEELLELEA